MLALRIRTDNPLDSSRKGVKRETVRLKQSKHRCILKSIFYHINLTLYCILYGSTNVHSIWNALIPEALKCFYTSQNC